MRHRALSRTMVVAVLAAASARALAGDVSAYDPRESLDVDWDRGTQGTVVFGIGSDSGATGFSVGMAETAAGRRGWYEEDCARGPCHTFVGTWGQLVYADTSVPGVSTRFAAAGERAASRPSGGDRLTYIVRVRGGPMDGTCFVWGDRPAYYRHEHCQVMRFWPLVYVRPPRWVHHRAPKDDGGPFDPRTDIDVIWTQRPRESVTFAIRGSGATGFMVGMAETAAGAGGWYGEDCRDHACHVFAGVSAQLTIAAPAAVEPGHTTAFRFDDSGPIDAFTSSGSDRLTYLVRLVGGPLDGQCYLWGDDAAYYAGMGCSAL
jgi:hypothetical protein